MLIFSTCQVGAETAFKKEVLRLVPDARAAFARPGFVSFKMKTSPPEDFANRLIFARTCCVFIGKIETDSPQQLVENIWSVVAEHRLFMNRVHVFQRDPLPMGEKDFEPPIPQELVELHRSIVAQSPNKKFLGAGAEDFFQHAQPGENVLDVLKVDPNLFLVGSHVVEETSSMHTRYSGGILPLTLPADAVSRAYLKFHEGFLWSGMAFADGDKCLDIGAAPGGCSQFLLQQGAQVFGVDPGAIHPVVINHPRFTPIRHRIRDVKRSLLRDVVWITADMNVAPNYTLEVLEEIIEQTPSVRGLLFTLKLIRWELADSLPALLDRIRTWGFSDVRIKQLVFNRQEVMITCQKRGSATKRQ
jgi:23S rRNA (cytidine2498-2'-O)-methyltransferase